LSADREVRLRIWEACTYGEPFPKAETFPTGTGSLSAAAGPVVPAPMGRFYRRTGAGRCKRRFCMEISIRLALTGSMHAAPRVSRWPHSSLEAWTCTVVHVQNTDGDISIYYVRIIKSLRHGVVPRYFAALSFFFFFWPYG
jgi:hypothetical protein